MQNCRHQINRNWSVALILVLTPFLLWATILILPTFDDWTSLTSPSFEPLLTKERWLFFGYHWRPFDSVFGYILGLHPLGLFPTLNHCCVVLGHICCSWIIYKLLSTLGFNMTAVNMATFFFFITPAAMATVLAIDSMNQTYALMWGLLSFWVYIQQKGEKYPIYITLIFIATLCKENGLMWAIINPVLAFGYDIINRKKLKKDLVIGIIMMITYATAIILLPKNIIIHPEYEPGIIKMMNNGAKFLLTTFVTIDYIYLLHQPNRNLLLAVVSFLLTLPFFYYIFIQKASVLKDKKVICSLLSLLIAVSPHIMTIFSMMHTYAGLPFLAIIMAYAINRYEQKIKAVTITFVFCILSAIAIDIHLWFASYQSGMIGKEMAVEAIKKTGAPVKNVYLITIEDNYPKLSSFCVIPYEAFGWGIATRRETDYQWPEVITDTIIERSPTAKKEAVKIGRNILSKKKFDCVWIVDHKQIDVIK